MMTPILRHIQAAIFLCFLATACELETFDVDLDANPPPTVLCGNGIVEGTEICDDGNTETETLCEYGTPLCISCNSDCSLEFSLTGLYCGDGFLDSEESCDDGNVFTEVECDYGIIECLACSQDCLQESTLFGRYCGDSWVDPEEVCDDGNAFTEFECEYGVIECFGCNEDCSVETYLLGGYCGDGICQPEEIPMQCTSDCHAIDQLPFCEDTLPQSFNISNIDGPGANSNQYTPPGAQVEDLLIASVDALLYSGDVQAAIESIEQGAGSALDYILCRDPEDHLVARWEPRLEGMGTSRFALRVGAAGGAIIGIPHGQYENHVVVQGVELFKNLGLRALIINGAHRCANDESSPCSGTSSVCGSQGAYRDSDMAHVDKTIFQWAHEIINQRFPNDLVLSIHGKSGSGINLSNGTKEPTSVESPVAQFALALSQGDSLDDEPIRTCNEFPSGPDTTGNLCGTTNIQGRMVNYSQEPCTTGPVQASDRFIHVEQSSEIRANYRASVEYALSTTLPF